MIRHILSYGNVFVNNVITIWTVGQWQDLKIYL